MFENNWASLRFLSLQQIRKRSNCKFEYNFLSRHDFFQDNDSIFLFVIKYRSIYHFQRELSAKEDYHFLTLLRLNTCSVCTFKYKHDLQMPLL